MGLPNFKLYYWACNLHAFSFWSHFDKQAESPIWVQMEHNSCYLTSLIALLFSPMPLSLQYVRNNPIVTQSLKLWSIIRKNYGWQSGSLLAPVHPTQLFSPSIRDISYGIWSQGGVDNMKALFIDNIFPTFEILRHTFNFPQSHFFRFLQVRSYIKANNPSFPNLQMNWPWKPCFLWAFPTGCNILSL